MNDTREQESATRIQAKEKINVLARKEENKKVSVLVIG
jgi:hypothetical protein